MLNISWEIEYLDMILRHSPNKVFKIVNHDHGFFPNLWSVWVGDHPLEDLAKFGYKWKRTIGKLGFHVLFVHMLEVGTYCLNNDNFIIFFLILWQLESIFSKKLICIIHTSTSFVVTMWKFVPKLENIHDNLVATRYVESWSAFFLVQNCVFVNFLRFFEILFNKFNDFSFKTYNFFENFQISIHVSSRYPNI